MQVVVLEEFVRVRAHTHTHTHTFPSFHCIHSNKERCRPRSLQDMLGGGNSDSKNACVCGGLVEEKSLIAILTLAS